MHASVTASGNISSSGTVTGLSGSFTELSGNSPLTVNGNTTFTELIDIADTKGLRGIRLQHTASSNIDHVIGTTTVQTITSTGVHSSLPHTASNAAVGTLVATSAAPGTIASNTTYRILTDGKVSASGGYFLTNNRSITSAGTNNLQFFTKPEVNGLFVFTIPEAASASIVPDTTDAGDLGNNTHQWRTAYVNNISASKDIAAAGNISASGHISASVFHGDGAGLTNVTATLSTGVVSGSAQLINLGAALTGSDVIFANVTASGNISSSGTVRTDKIIFDEDENSYIEVNDTDSIRIVAGGQQMIVFDHDTGDRIITGFGKDVGIGIGNTSTPAANLHVRGNIWASGSDNTAHITASGNISSSGNVIGVTGSFSHLQGNSPINVGSGVIFQQAITASGDMFVSQYITHTGDTDTQINFLDDEIRFEAGNLLLFDIHKKGSAPHEVTVNTGGNNVDFIIKDDGNNTYFIADASTNRVGIGTITPEEALTVTGNISASGTFIGDGSTLTNLAGALPTGIVSSSAQLAASISGSFGNDGSALTNLQRPITSSDVGFQLTASNDNAGIYFRVSGEVTCSILPDASASCAIGNEFEFFQTSSAGSGFLFVTSSTAVTLNSKSGNVKLSGQFSGATLKKVGTNEYDLIGDLG